jgi:hypothetical protein
MNESKLRACYQELEQVWPSFDRAIFAAPNDGLVMEFGVASGGSFNQICKIVAPRKVFGFDWFYGLPEYWNTSNPKGKFSTKGVVPKFPVNGEIVVGLVEETLANFLKSHTEPVAFAHLDLDIYSATSYVLNTLGPRCVDGTVLLFDEIFGNPYHEEKAFLEFLNITNFDFEFVTRRNRDAIAFRLHAR